MAHCLVPSKVASDNNSIWSKGAKWGHSESHPHTTWPHQAAVYRVPTPKLECVAVKYMSLRSIAFRKAIIHPHPCSNVAHAMVLLIYTRNSRRAKMLVMQAPCLQVCPSYMSLSQPYWCISTCYWVSKCGTCRCLASLDACTPLTV